MVDMTTDDKYVCFFFTDFVAQNFKTPKVPISQGTKLWSLPIFCASEVCGVRNQLFRKNRHMVAILKVDIKLEHLKEFPETDEHFERPGFIKRVSC